MIMDVLSLVGSMLILALAALSGSIIELLVPIDAGLLQDAVGVELDAPKAIAALRIHCDISLGRHRFEMISSFQIRSRCEPALLLAGADSRVFAGSLLDNVLL